MNDLLTVILPSYNPDPERLRQTILGLQQQTLSSAYWELIIVDNNSSPPVAVDLSWHPQHRIIMAPKQGLTYARLKGFEHAKGDIIVMVDDDNILNDDYLENVRSIFTANAQLGAIGGRSLPLFETHPPGWLHEFYGNLALRDMGEDVLISGWKNRYPACAPIGAGMGIRKTALQSYINKQNTGSSRITDRTGTRLSSGGDNDLVLEVITSGWLAGYFPALILKHIIPQERMKVSYLAKLSAHTNASWVQVLHQHQINPWAHIPLWTVPLRKIKAWFTYHAWKNPQSYIRWQGACGLFDGLAQIK